MMRVKSFSDYVAEHRESHGARSTLEQAVPSAVLIQSRERTGQEPDQRRYKTEHNDVSSQGPVTKPGGAARKHAAGPSGGVYPLRKRKDAPFSTHVGVGRASNVDVCLPLPRLSKFHAYFVESAGGTMAVADADSKNGTWVDGHKLGPKQPAPLRDGSTVRLGPYEFVFFGAESFRRAVERGTLE